MTKVRCGQVIRVTTVSSPAPLGRTAIVEFVSGSDALTYAEYMRFHATDVFGPGVRVFLANTKSYPMATETQCDIENGFTRLLVLFDALRRSPQAFLDDFQSFYRDPREVLEDVWMGEHGLMFVLFKDIKFASRFYKGSIWRHEYFERQDWVSNPHGFAKDPCDNPIDPFDGFQPARGSNTSVFSEWILSKEYIAGLKEAGILPENVDSNVRNLDIETLGDPNEFLVWTNQNPEVVAAREIPEE
ncbi:uncharacterized protein F4822DRAFT_440596 [Hypoxylon trugodes]|uniref:uncharacterized protein n=1 Tax=Hypoxylon trugodes TaxID=326681 RepID=UPI00219DCFE2|nr:uncharacterized protein F4822DRAFT_440596 [Hypoxylon trugodes]KAI1383570.1 hypothetical protein F4822DRAFT_440596 [Hypoxylon trugodes]